MSKRILNLCRAELLKLSRQRLPYVAAVVVALVTFLSLYGSMRSVASDVEKEQKGFQDDRSSVLTSQNGEGVPATNEKEDGFFPKVPRSKGFECLILTWQYSLSITSFFLLVFGSLLVSSEVASGTARTALQRPVRRVEFLLAKAIVLAAAVLLSAVFVGVFSAGLVRALIGFGDVMDLEWGKVFVTESQMVGYQVGADAPCTAGVRGLSWLFRFLVHRQPGRVGGRGRDHALCIWHATEDIQNVGEILFRSVFQSGH